MVCHGDLNSLLESSEVVGNIRFSHPTLYVFPGGQGDSALFGINGFNMLGEFKFHALICGHCSVKVDAYVSMTMNVIPEQIPRTKFLYLNYLNVLVFQWTVASQGRLAFGTLFDTWIDWTPCL